MVMGRSSSLVGTGLLLIALSLGSCSSRTDANDVLVEARRLTSQRKFAQALEKHIWFHQHALESQPSLYGVRLSIALEDWVALGNQYPDALVALRRIRDQAAVEFLAHPTHKGLFEDYQAINAALNESAETVKFFRALGLVSPELARSLWPQVCPTLIAAGEWALARQHLGEPNKRLAAIKQRLDTGRLAGKVADFTGDSDVADRAVERGFVTEVVQLIQVLSRAGDITAAQEIQREALASVDSPNIRDVFKQPAHQQGPKQLAVEPRGG